MNGPDRIFLRGAWPAAGKQRTRCVVVLRFHEELGKRRMRLVRTAVVKTNFGIAGQLESTCPPTMVGDRQDPDFSVNIWRDTNCPGDLDVSGATKKIGPVSVE